MSPRPARPNDFDEFVKRSLFVAALVGLGILLWFLWGVLLLIFAGALLAIAIRDLPCRLRAGRRLEPVAQLPLW